MDVVRLHPGCIDCLLKKQIGRYPENVSDETKIEYKQRVFKILSGANRSMSAPEIVADIYALQREMFGVTHDYTEIKRYFNDLMLSIEDELAANVMRAGDPLLMAVQYAICGNYIDFAAMETVDEGELKKRLGKAKDIPVDARMLDKLREDIRSAKTLSVITDNCGEIVLDKILVSVIKRMNSDIKVTFIVRGFPVINDATKEDAEQIGLYDVAEVIDNGSNIGGTCLHKISDESRRVIDAADIIISKGQANFETLYECGRNIYYIFMCKCELFKKRFNVPMFTGMLKNDKEL